MADSRIPKAIFYDGVKVTTLMVASTKKYKKDTEFKLENIVGCPQKLGTNSPSQSKMVAGLSYCC